MSGKPFRLFVWELGYRTDYTDGLAVAVAHDVDEARELLIASGEPSERDIIEMNTRDEPDKVLDLPAAIQIAGGS